MPCKPGVAGSIPGFSIKPTFGEPLGVPVIKPTQILNQPGGTGLYPGKPQKKHLDAVVGNLICSSPIDLIIMTKSKKGCRNGIVSQEVR